MIEGESGEGAFYLVLEQRIDLDLCLKGIRMTGMTIFFRIVGLGFHVSGFSRCCTVLSTARLHLTSTVRGMRNYK